MRSDVSANTDHIENNRKRQSNICKTYSPRKNEDFSMYIVGKKVKIELGIETAYDGYSKNTTDIMKTDTPILAI